MQEFSNKVRGFYYDKQMQNPLITARLFPNQVLAVAKDGTTQWVNPRETDEADEKYFNKDISPSINEKKCWYSKIPIVTSILSEDFTVTVVNTWSELSGDPLGQLWNSRKPLAPYMKMMGDVMGQIASATANYDFSNSKVMSNGTGQALAEFFSKISQNSKIQSKLLGRSLVVQGTQFTYFGGTGTDFGSLGMKFTVFADYFADGWRSVFRQLTGMDESGRRYETGLIDYAMGDYIPLLDSVTRQAVPDFVKNGEISKFLNSFAQWQLPPGGYESALKNIDTIQKGTLKLDIGPWFSVANLVIQNIQFSFSKTMIKRPDDWIRNGSCRIEPISCDVTISLKPATLSSKNSMLDFISGNMQAGKRRKLQEALRQSLESIEENNEDSEREDASEREEDLRLYDITSDIENKVATEDFKITVKKPPVTKPAITKQEKRKK